MSNLIKFRQSINAVWLLSVLLLDWVVPGLFLMLTPISSPFPSVLTLLLLKWVCPPYICRASTVGVLFLKIHFERMVLCEIVTSKSAPRASLTANAPIVL